MKTSDIKPGDQVTHKEDRWDSPLTVERIMSGRNGVDEPVAIFKEGGFWRISQLTKVN